MAIEFSADKLWTTVVVFCQITAWTTFEFPISILLGTFFVHHTALWVNSSKGTMWHDQLGLAEIATTRSPKSGFMSYIRVLWWILWDRLSASFKAGCQGRWWKAVNKTQMETSRNKKKGEGWREGGSQGCREGERGRVREGEAGQRGKWERWERGGMGRKEMGESRGEKERGWDEREGR